nr:putative reverse transcriptase domain-containing protein [Tanacetum cinerariifolium]
LSPRFIGPFEILDRVGEVSYRLALPPQLSHVHDVFQFSLPRGYKYHPLHVISYPLDQIRTALSYTEEPEAILGRQDRVMRKKTIPFEEDYSVCQDSLEEPSRARSHLGNQRIYPDLLSSFPSMIWIFWIRRIALEFFVVSGEVQARIHRSAGAHPLRRAVWVSNPNLVLSSYTTSVDVFAAANSNITSLGELMQPAVSVMNPSNMFAENGFGLINVLVRDAIPVSFGFDSTILADGNGIGVTRLAGKFSLSSENITTQVHDDGSIMDSAKASFNVNKDNMSFSTSMKEPIVQAVSISMKPSSYAGVTSFIHSKQVVNSDVLLTKGNDDAFF